MQKFLKPKATSNASSTVMKKRTARLQQVAQSVEDDDEMAQEYHLLKNLKRGAINEIEFAKLSVTEDLL